MSQRGCPEDCGATIRVGAEGHINTTEYSNCHTDIGWDTCKVLIGGSRMG